MFPWTPQTHHELLRESQLADFDMRTARASARSSPPRVILALVGLDVAGNTRSEMSGEVAARIAATLRYE
jgi:hypothetical protein